MMTPEQRASHARDLLNNPVLNEALDNIEAAAVNAMAFAAPADHDTRQAKAAEVRAVRDIRSALQTVIAEASFRPRVASS